MSRWKRCLLGGVCGAAGGWLLHLLIDLVCSAMNFGWPVTSIVLVPVGTLHGMMVGLYGSQELAKTFACLIDDDYQPVAESEIRDSRQEKDDAEKGSNELP